uniref:Uncharacterized protein n=1 Tax=Anguilla anguilla TaxID=7936 RepID=A0A0E9V1N0_ANGAN
MLQTLLMMSSSCSAKNCGVLDQRGFSDHAVTNTVSRVSFLAQEGTQLRSHLLVIYSAWLL